MPSHAMCTFFCFALPCTQILLTMFKKKNVSTAFIVCVYVRVCVCILVILLVFDVEYYSIHTIPHLCHFSISFLFFFAVFDFDFVRVTHWIKVCVHIQNSLLVFSFSLNPLSRQLSTINVTLCDESNFSPQYYVQFAFLSLIWFQH